MNTDILKTEYLRPNVTIDICKHSSYPHGIFYVKNYKGLVWEVYIELSQLMADNSALDFTTEDELEEYLDSEEFTAIMDPN